MKHELPERKKIRMKHFNYASIGSYFITVCTINKEKILWDTMPADAINPKEPPLSDIGKVVEKGILQISEHYNRLTVDKYTIMPDHIHLLLTIHTNKPGESKDSTDIKIVVGSLKRWISRQIGHSIWQKSFYEHCVRNHNDYDECYDYIRRNPEKYIKKSTTRKTY